MSSIGRTIRVTAVIASLALAGAMTATSSPAVGAPGAAPASDAGPSQGDREPANTTISGVDGTNVVTQYGRVVPAFDGYDTPQPTRKYLPLDGAWRFRFDPAAVGTQQGWQDRRHDTAGWDTIAVPSSWDLKDTPGFDSYDGSSFGNGTAFQDGDAWYRLTTHIPGTWSGDQLRLNFLGVNYRADIWLNGQYVGAHEGGHTPFALPVTDALKPGQDATIAVRVNRRASYTNYQGTGTAITDPKAVPWKPVDYWPYAGITRSAWLEAVPQVSIPKVLLAAKEGHLDARVIVENRATTKVRAQVRLDTGRGTGAMPVVQAVDVGPHSVAVATFRVAIPDAPQWSTSKPQLLTATAQLRLGPPQSSGPATDQLTATYGMRAVDVENSALRVNGEPVFLKGLNWHEETARWPAMTEAEYDTELGSTDDLGANFLRNSVYNRHPYVYEWADAHGVLVMDDIDTMWLNTAQERLQTEEYGLSKAMALSMAWNQHNNPSVILWGLQNESEIDAGGAPVYKAWLADMKNAVKAVDLQDRPVTWASNTTNDPAFDIADVVGFNEYFGYFYGKNADLGPAIDGVHAKYPTKPILITENGSCVHPGPPRASHRAGHRGMAGGKLPLPLGPDRRPQGLRRRLHLLGPEGLQAACRIQPGLQRHLRHGHARVRLPHQARRLRRLRRSIKPPLTPLHDYNPKGLPS